MARTLDDLTLLTSVQISGADWFMLRDADAGTGSGAEKGITLTNLTTAIVSLGFTGAVSTIVSSNLTANRATVSNGSGKLAVSEVTATELGYVSGVTSAIQTQLDAKAPLSSPTFIDTPRVPTATTGTNTTQAASTAFVQQELAAAVVGLLEFKGNLDCGADPNYPAGSVGDLYYVSVSGHIGGFGGKSVDVGDAVICKANASSGNEGAAGGSWFVLERNAAGLLLAANNLSDLASASTARTNLGLTAIATLSAPADDGVYDVRFVGGVPEWHQIADPDEPLWMKFDADALDYSGNDNNGTLEGTATISSGLQIAAADDGVTVADSASLSMTGPMTLAAKFTVSGNGTILVKRRSGSWTAPYADYMLRVGAGKAQACFGDAGQTVDSTTDVDDSTEHTVVATWDGTTATIYVDGIEENTLVPSGVTLQDTSEPLEIGFNSTNGEDLQAGDVVRSVKLFNYCLDAGEVASLTL